MQNVLTIGRFLWNARLRYQPIAWGGAPSVRSCPPPLSEFRIPADFDFASFIDRQQRMDKAAPWMAVAATVLALMLSEVLFILVAIAAYFALPHIVALANGDAAMRPRVKGFLTAQAEWEYFSETTGEGFWRSLRGTDLENAVERLFLERGWEVETTALTGDGGIDLMLRRGARKICVQCKGYAKPVSVAAVREIAGVCSASNAEPMLVVVNGITKPAQAEAGLYSVTVWGSRELALFARNETQYGEQL